MSEERILGELNRIKEAKGIILPPTDAGVREKLKSLGEPRILFGEKDSERRDRLRFILSKNTTDGDESMQIDDKGPVKSHATESEMDDKMEEDEDEEFFTEGSQDLLRSRRDLVLKSLIRAKSRLAQEKEWRETSTATVIRERRSENHSKLKTMVNVGSQVGGDRAISFVSFAPDEIPLLATSNWSGVCSIWSVPTLEPIVHLNEKGHTDRATCIRFHPQFRNDRGSRTADVATCGSDSQILLWSISGDNDSNLGPIGSLTGHKLAVNRIAFHPMGKFLASTSNDTSWRMWDIATQQELLLQEGHSHPVYCVDFHGDGSLAITGSLDASGRIWDLRTGRSIMVLQGHSGPVLSALFKGNGYQVATGSSDNSIRIWDMRAGGSNRQTIQVIPAHSNNVCGLTLAAIPRHRHEKFLPYQAEVLVSASYDSTVKMWSGQDAKPVTSWKAHESHVTSVSFTCNSESQVGYLATGSFDRTFKLWKTE